MFSLFVVLLAIGASLAAPQNPEEPELPLITSQGNYFLYGPGNWHTATEVCRAKSMRAVKIDSAEKNEEVTLYIKSVTVVEGPYWTLGSRLLDGKNWVFGHDDPMKYFNWAPSSPKLGGDEKCILIRKDGFWIDASCTKDNYVICEKYGS